VKTHGQAIVGDINVGWGTARFAAAYAAGKLGFFGAHAHLADAKAFAAFLAPLKRIRWFICSKRPFAGPQAVLAYLSRVAISNGRLIAASAGSVTLKSRITGSRGWVATRL